MSKGLKSLAVKGFAVAASSAAAVLCFSPGAQAAPDQNTPQPPPALVHAAQNNACQLNIRVAPDVGAQPLHTLNCDTYTTCVGSDGSAPCAPYVVGGTYSCVGPENTQVTDNRWAAVTWRSPEQSYVAVACAAFVQP